MIESYPLYWPEGWKRTESWRRHSNRHFTKGFAASRDELLAEIKRLGGNKIIMSTNIPLRNDGLPYANTREPADGGVAVYFEYKGKPMCFACDRYKYCRENVRAIALTIEALRGIERWGASDMIERAFRGFTAIPETTGTSWRDLLGFTSTQPVNEDDVETAFRRLAHSAHPDKGGDTQRFQALMNARRDARRALGLTA